MGRTQYGPEQMGGNEKLLFHQISFITPWGLLRAADLAPTFIWPRRKQGEGGEGEPACTCGEWGPTEVCLPQAPCRGSIPNGLPEGPPPPATVVHDVSPGRTEGVL